MNQLNENRQPVNENRQPIDIQPSNNPLAILARLVWIIALVIISILAVRFLFILFGARSSNGFVDFIYSISYPLARPFFGIFGYNVHYGISRVEPASLVAIVVYAIGAYLLVRLLTINRAQTTL